MARTRRRQLFGLGAALALAIGAIAIVLPMALASTVVDAGTLRLHLASGGDYFQYRLPDGTSGGLQTLGTTKCEYRYTGDLLASLSPTPASAKVGLISHGLGVKTSSEGTTAKCGEVNAPSEVLTLKVPSTGPLAGKDFDYAELDIEVHGNAPINMALYDGGTQVDASPGDGTTLDLVVNCKSSPSSCGPASNRNWRIRVPSAGSVRFDEIRLWASGSSSKYSIELEGGNALWYPGGLGASLETRDSVFHVVSTGEPVIGVTKTADETPVSAGDAVGFSIEVTNTGTGDAAGVVATDPLPTDAGLDWTIDSQDGSACSIEAGALTCTMDTLSAGSSYAVHITSPTDSTTVADSPVDNSVDVTTSDDSTAHASASVEVLGTEISVAKTADATSVPAGDPVGFAIEVSNGGPGRAFNVVATDPLPTDAGLDWTIDSQDGSACSIEAGALTCTMDTLSTGSSYAVHITSPTDSTTVADSPVDNSVDVTTSNDGTANASASVEVFEGTLGCTPGEDDTAIQGGSGGAPAAALDREPNFDASGCVLVPYSLETGVDPETDAAFVHFTKALESQTDAQFYLTIDWAPETPTTPVDPGPTTIAGRTTQIDFGTGLHAIQWCAGTTIDGNGDTVPLLPGGELWCLTQQGSTLQPDGTVQVTEKLYGLGDPGIVRQR